MAAKRHTRIRVASTAIVVFMLVVVATWISVETSKPDPVVPTSPEQAEALLNEAVRLVQANNYGGLCEALKSRSNCEVHLQEAQQAGLVPSKIKPDVLEATQLAADEVSLRLRGTYANGQTYETEFHVFRTREQLEVTNAVFWLPIRRAQADCVHEPQHVRCEATATPPR